jgi:hypothetical protein
VVGKGKGLSGRVKGKGKDGKREARMGRWEEERERSERHTGLLQGLRKRPFGCVHLRLALCGRKRETHGLPLCSNPSHHILQPTQFDLTIELIRCHL